jgi:NH3-dependent NAD+ synthetase
VLPGVNNKEELLGSFLVTDQVLWGLENRLPHEEMLLHFGEENTNKIIALWESSKHMRESPYRFDQS